jgi:hypothetical protein
MQSIDGGLQLRAEAWVRVRYTTGPSAPAPAAAGPAGSSDADGTIASAVLDALGGGGGSAGTGSPGVAEVANALKAALAGGAAGDDLLDKLGDALKGVRKQLVSAGYSPQDAARAVASFRARLADRLDALASAAADPAPPANPPALPATTDATPASTTAGSPPVGTTSGPAVTPAPATAGGASPPPTDPAPSPGTPATGAAGTPSTGGTPPTTTTGGSPGTPAPTSGAFLLSERAGLKIVTQEGDVVRIRIRYAAAGEFTTSGAPAAGTGGAPATAGSAATGLAAYGSVGASLYQTAGFSIDVRGSLNDQELAAIQDVLGQVDQLASKFFSGDTSAAFAAGANLGFDPTVLAGYSLKLSQTVALQLDGPAPAPLPAGTGSGTTPAATGGTAAATPPATPPPPVATTPPATTTPPAGAAGTGTSTPATGTTATGTPATGTGGGTPAATDPIASITQYLRELFSTLGTTTQAGRITISARAKLELTVAAIDAARVSQSPQEKAATGFLSATLAKVADAGTTPAAGTPAA